VRAGQSSWWTGRARLTTRISAAVSTVISGSIVRVAAAMIAPIYAVSLNI
jgi:hypothetical protein